MATTRDLPAVKATESSPADHDSARLCILPDADRPGSSASNLDLAYRPGPLDPPDLPVLRAPRPGPTSPTPPAVSRDSDLTTPSSRSPEIYVSQANTAVDGHDDGDIVIADSTDTPPRRDKGKAPEMGCLLPAFAQNPNTRSNEDVPGSSHRLQDPPGTAMEEEYTGNSVYPIETATNEDNSGNSSPGASSGTQDPSYPSSLFDEPQDRASTATSSALADHVTSWKQKQKQKADPEAETDTFSDQLTDEHSIQPLGVGDPGWEASSGRAPQKLPIHFRDAVGRNFIFPWEKAKTWTGMRRLIQSCFLFVDVLGPHVMAGRYDLLINLPLPMDANGVISPSSTVTPTPSLPSPSTAEIPSSSAASGSSSTVNLPSSSSSSQQQHKSSFIVLPELWDDTIEPGMLVVQHMWPFQTPNFVAQPVQPSPAQPQPPHHHPPAPARGRGAIRGRGRGPGIFGGRGGIGANILPPHPIPASRPPMIAVNPEPPMRGKTRKRQDRR
ncbi:hypothetical protein F4802DRAFT_593709 [Xylaria palmicola]|nr:hypothetical protein F4802DRAFT_593709 [Xylaria palmicola]